MTGRGGQRVGQHGTAARRPRARAGRRMLALCALPVAGLVMAACGAGGGSAAPSSSGHRPTPAVVASTRSTTPTTTTSSVPECGTTRDPFDPTDSPAPAGSPAHC
ncbi:MAG: hypothetical protein ACRDY3_13595 [Acidimicrobiales bacterium]